MREEEQERRTDPTEQAGEARKRKSRPDDRRRFFTGDADNPLICRSID
jgi:hypothetical protein